MTIRKFSLIPFPGAVNAPGIRITGSIVRRRNRLSVGYAVIGNLTEISIPLPKPFKERKDRLWTETCLEFFIGMTDSEAYWEFNLSPAGDWNVYGFTSCRAGMRDEQAFTSLPFAVRMEPEKLDVSLDLDIGKIIPAEKAIDVAACAVIKTVKGEMSHWASAHPAPRPDFHRRDGFKLSFPGLESLKDQ